MASGAARQDTTATQLQDRFTHSMDQELQSQQQQQQQQQQQLHHHHQLNYHHNQTQQDQQQPQYLSLCSSSSNKHDSVRFVEQPQQQLYENHQEHKSFIENPCDCYQSGSNQVCSRCQTHEEQNNAGAFIYQPIQTHPNDGALQSGRLQIQQNHLHHHQQAIISIQSTGYSTPSSSPTSSSSSSSSSSSLGKQLDNSAFQEPVYESNNKYYLKQPIGDDGYTNSAPRCAESSDLISNSLRCQTFSSSNNNNSHNNNNNNNNNKLIIENDCGGSDGMFYQCSSNNNNEPTQYANHKCHEATDDWRTRSLGIEIDSTNEDKLSLFNSTNIDSNNNNNAEAQQFSTAQYSMIQIAQETKKSPCQAQQHQEYQHQFNNNNHFTSIQNHYNDYQPTQSYGGTPIAAADQQMLLQPGISSYSSLQQQPSQHSVQRLQSDGTLGGPFMVNSSNSSGQSCFLSSGEGSSYQLSAADQSSSSGSSKSKARRKNPGALSKVNGKLWEFIRDLLLSDRTNPAFIRWERREDGVFKFVESNKVAKMWGERKQNPKMTYEKLSRAMRYYYKSKVLLPVFGRRLVYKFGPNASGWNNKTE